MPTDEEPIKIICGDCLEVMKQIPDDSIDLVLTDPPYGILNGKESVGGGNMCKVRKYPPISWDNKPSKELFKEIFRISKNQIIFGAEYFSDMLPQSKGWYIWYKNKPEGTNFASCELIWTSFNIPNRIIKFTWNGMIKDKSNISKEEIYHITQKPQKVIRILLNNHSSKKDIVLDCFLGSGTTAVACKQLGRKCLGIEISPEYVKIAKKRLQQEVLFK